MDFSRRECAEIRLIGRSTSISRLQYLSTHGLRSQNLVGLDVIMLDSDDRLPAHPCRVLDQMHFSFGCAIKHYVKPEIVLQSLGSLVLVRCKGNFTNL